MNIRLSAVVACVAAGALAGPALALDFPARKPGLWEIRTGDGTGKDAEGQRQLKILNNLIFGVFKPADNAHLLPVREMEAAEALIQAQNAGNAEAVKKAEADLKAISREATARQAAPQALPDKLPDAQ